MPSWNIHIAQTERLLERPGAVARAVHDPNVFLFGNLVPDILVGYMVPGVVHPIPYRITHFAVPGHIPKPREGEFWDMFVVPQAARRAEAEARARETGFDDMDAAHARAVFDITLGAWAHLTADCIWNTHVNEFLDSIGGKPGEVFRIKKQGDFDAFGKTLAIHSVPEPTPALLRAAEAFPQYPINERFAHDAIVVTHEIVRTNPGVPDHAPYRLLSEGFFNEVFVEVVDTTDRLVAERLPACLPGYSPTEPAV